jgi:hypothetical protein
MRVMLRTSAAIVVASGAFVLALSAPAGAGPPPSCGRLHCDLTYYEATQAFKAAVGEKLRADGLTAVSGGPVGCGPTRHDARGYARCSTRIEGGRLSAPCTFEALLSRAKGPAFRVRWWKESPSCRA